MLAFFRRRVLGPEEAFDLTAETFAAALASLPRFEPGPEPPQAWLFAIARHKWSEARRSDRVQDEARRALAMQPIQLDDEAIEILEATAQTPAIELLETLAPEQREAVKAHHLEERGYSEIAAEARCSESVMASFWLPLVPCARRATAARARRSSSVRPPRARALRSAGSSRALLVRLDAGARFGRNGHGAERGTPPRNRVDSENGDLVATAERAHVVDNGLQGAAREPHRHRPTP